MASKWPLAFLAYHVPAARLERARQILSADYKSAAFVIPPSGPFSTIPPTNSGPENF
jgi:hypothetical protein